eukprot:scaffold249228_cov19-Prasinocladus_malaysianus.AAC.1
MRFITASWQGKAQARSGGPINFKQYYYDLRYRNPPSFSLSYGQRLLNHLAVVRLPPNESYERYTYEAGTQVRYTHATRTRTRSPKARRIS